MRNLFSKLIPISLIFLSCTTTPLIPDGETKPNLNYVPAHHLVFIGFDGWGSFYLDQADMPTVKRMISDGSSSTEVLSVLPSRSWPNWSSLFMGTPPKKQGKNDFPTIFSLVKNFYTEAREDFETKPFFFYEWDDLFHICSNEVAFKHKIESDYVSVHTITTYIKEKKPVFTAIVFGEPDTTGHANGWGSKEYYEKLTLLDNFIEIIEQSIKDSEIYDTTVFVFSSDHGGIYRNHGLNIERNRKIPLIFFGSGIKKAYTIPFQLNIYDIAPTMAAILGLQAPTEWTGKPIFHIFN
jgi:predicted AlkP superfamily pyrophosphatase or phosphodiesterase